METFHLYHLAACWGGKRQRETVSAPPLTTGPVKPSTSSPQVAASIPIVLQDTVIRAAAAQIIFASRISQAFITPEQVSEAERWTGIVSSLFGQLCNQVRKWFDQIDNRLC
jgi:uridine phosphorylase